MDFDHRFATIGIALLALMISAFVFKELLDIRSIVMKGTPTPSGSDTFMSMFIKDPKTSIQSIAEEGEDDGEESEDDTGTGTYEE
jgi:hypothetical protein